MINKILVIVIFIMIIISSFFFTNNLFFTSESDRQQLMQLLEIESTSSFRPYYKKYGSCGIHGRTDGYYYAIRFKISIEDYKKNRLEYPDYKANLETYKKKRFNNYICTIKVYSYSEGKNKELFEKIDKEEAPKRREKNLRMFGYINI